jgi:riboflavin kinase / FMN adenylyltransferase
MLMWKREMAAHVLGRYPISLMSAPQTVLSIGSFDGVHAAHVALVRDARHLADAGGARAVALCFDPHPATLLRPQAVPPRLTTFGQRRDLLLAAGAHEVVRLEPTRELLSKSPEEFIGEVVERFAPLAFVEGRDFHFGHRRAGTIQTLEGLGERYGFTVHIHQTMEAALTDNTVVPVSSTLVRWLLEQGRVRDAAIVLGRAYAIEGRVVKGDRRGRQIGFPTANIDTPCLVPGDGVYGGTAELEDGRCFTAAISIGSKPTFSSRGRALEAFLLNVHPEDASGCIPGLPEYGWNVRLTLSHWLRDQAKFGSVAELIDQMHRDCQRIASLSEPRPHGLAACP